MIIATWMWLLRGNIMSLSLGKVAKASTLGNPFYHTQLQTAILHLQPLLLIFSKNPWQLTPQQKACPWRFHCPCWSYMEDALTSEGDSVPCKSAPGESKVMGSGAYSYVTYISIWHICASKLPWLLKISILFFLNAYLPVTRMYILIKISKSLEVSQFPLTMNGMSPNAHWKAKLLCPIFEKCCSHTIVPEARMELWTLSFPKKQPCVHTDRITPSILVYFFPMCWMILEEPLGNMKKAEVSFRVYSKFLRTYNKPANRQLKRKPKSADHFSRHPN